MTHIGLFEGIGGFSIAAKNMEWETIAWCEINPFCQTVLKHHYPNATPHHDIKQTDFTIYRGKCDIITGGFPCQPYSTAGKRLGKEDERHLWPEMLRAIREIAPRWVVGENVRGLLSWNGGLVFDEVQADLEACGYEVQPFILPACGVNAPHRRDRIWFVAKNTNEDGWTCDIEQKESEVGKLRNIGARDHGRIPTDNGSIGITSNTESQGPWEFEQSDQVREDRRFDNDGKIRDASDANGIGLWGESDGARESIEPSEISARGNWHNFPTISPICSRNDGLSLGLSDITFSKWRNESIKALGNAVVPQVVLQIFEAIEQYEQHL